MMGPLGLAPGNAGCDSECQLYRPPAEAELPDSLHRQIADWLLTSVSSIRGRWKKTPMSRVDDIAKRLIDYGFHAPTMSFPVAGTLMIEPTESESLYELDRFCRAMNLIYAEYEKVKIGEWPADNNPLHNAPHTLDSILGETHRVYITQEAVCPDPEFDYRVKYWPPVGRVDNVYGDRNLVCSCPPMSEYDESATEPELASANP